jgi:hypothetical protein
MAVNTNFDTIATAAIESRARKLSDNLSRSNAVLFALKEHGGIKPYTGGTKILQELSYGNNPNTGSYSGLEQLTTAAHEFMSAAEFAVKQYRGSVILSGLQMAQASGKERMIDLLAAAIDNTETSLINEMVEGIYSDGTGNSGKNITGLQATLDLTPAVGIYGNINAATAGNEFWRNKALTGTAITSANVLAKFGQMYNSLVRGVEHPDVIIANTTHYEALETALQANQRFGEADRKLAQAGFMTLRFKGASVVLENDSDTGMPSTQSFFLTTKYLHLRPYGSMDFKTFGPDESDGYDAWKRNFKWYGNLTCSRRIAQGVVSDS